MKLPRKGTVEVRAALRRRLDAIIVLLMETGPAPSRTATDKVVRLRGVPAGIQPRDG
jgi:hypothetical protein